MPEEKQYDSRRYDYASAVFGSEAYDPDWLFTEYEPEPEPPQTEEPARQPAKKPAAKPRTGLRVRADEEAARSTQALPLFAVLGVAAVVCLAVLTLLANVHLMQLRSETKAMERQLSELQKTQAQLDVAYAAAFDLNDVRDYAENNLGMTKPDESQIHYVDMGYTDTAVVYHAQEDAPTKAISSVVSIWQTLLAYFK